ncbi:hypothetical protein KEM54_005724, partial [Ascosphaera aggregata]
AIDATSSGRPVPRRQHSSTAAPGGGFGVRVGVGAAGSSAGAPYNAGSRLSKTLLDYDTRYPPAITTPTHVFTESASADGGAGAGAGASAGAGVADTDCDAMVGMGMGAESRDIHSVGVGGFGKDSSPSVSSFTSQSKSQVQRSQQQQQQQQYAATLPSRSPSDMNYYSTSIPSSTSSTSQSFSTVSAPTTPGIDVARIASRGKKECRPSLEVSENTQVDDYKMREWLLPLHMSK